jgi:hypothetical protein
VELMMLRNRLLLVHAIEDYENKDHMENEISNMQFKLGGKISFREATWHLILESNRDNIVTLLIDENRPMTADEVEKWIAVALDLYRAASDDHIYNTFSPGKITINSNTKALAADAIKLAVAVCKKLPVPYSLLSYAYRT